MEEIKIVKDVTIVPDIKTIWDLQLAFKEGRIATIPEWLQRLEQPTKWHKNKGKKILSFLRSTFNGNSFCTPFYLVKIEVLIEHLREECERHLEQIVQKIYSEMLADLEKKQSLGVQYILLDGQNRLKHAIVPFFEGTLKYNNYEKPFHFIVNKKDFFLNNFRFTDIDLDDEIREIFKNTQVVIAEGLDGYIQSYVDSVVDMNNGEPWSEFESTIIRPTALNYLINRSTFDNPLIQSLFGNHSFSGHVSDMSGNYLIEKKGDGKFIAELVYMIGNNCNSGVGTENSNCKMLLSSDERFITAFEKVKDYLYLISTTFDFPKNPKPDVKMFDRTSLTTMVLFLDVMYNTDNILNHNCVLKLKSLSKPHFESPKLVLEEFMKWYKHMIDRFANPDDFVGREPKPETFVINTRNDGRLNIIGRLKFINQFIVDNHQEWLSRGYISESSADYKKYEQLLKEKTNYTDVYSKANSKIDLRSKVSIDHVIARNGPRKGTDDIDNLVPTNALSNSIKGALY